MFSIFHIIYNILLGKTTFWKKVGQKHTKSILIILILNIKILSQIIRSVFCHTFLKSILFITYMQLILD